MKFKFLFPIILCSMLSDAYGVGVCCNAASMDANGNCKCYQGEACCTGGVVTTTCDSTTCKGTTWKNLGDGLEEGTTQQCVTGISGSFCNTAYKTEYRCSTGYYCTNNDTTNCTSCSECPSHTDKNNKKLSVQQVALVKIA